MISERTIINALILAAGLIVGPYLTISTFQGQYWPILIAGGATFLMIVFFLIGNRICALPLLGLSFGGHLTFLPAGMSAADVCAFGTILYYLVTYVALKQKWVKLGPPELLFPIVIIGLIMIYHLHSFGLRALGGSQQGSRPAILILACAMSYLCGINIFHPSNVFLRRLPLYALGLAVISNLPFIITTYAPSTANTFIYLTDNVNISAYFNENIVREGAMSGIGSALQVVLLAYFPIYTWWRPERWWVVFLSLACFYMVVMGGYRSGLALYALTLALGAWCHCSWRSLILLPPLLSCVLALSLLKSSNLVSLPLTVQRSMSFLPGAWDKEVEDNAKDSNDFRNSILQVYKREYLAKSPVLGNGFTFDQSELQAILDKGNSDDGYYSIKAFIITKSFHIGWISVYDAVGIVGTAAFVLLGFNVCYMAGRPIFVKEGEGPSSLLPLRIWIFCNVTRDMIGYFTVFGNFPITFTGLCGYAIILSQMRDIERQHDTETDRIVQPEFFGLPEMKKHQPV